MKNEYYSIGEVSKVLGITITTIRHYEKEGLIEPAYIDPSSNYRYYDLVDFWDLEIIRTCKNLGFTLKEIKELKSSQNMEELLKLSHVLKARIRNEIEKFEKTYENLEWLEKKWVLNKQQNEQPQKTPYIKDFPEIKVLQVTLDDVEESYKDETCYLQQSRLHMEIQKTYRKVFEKTHTFKVDFGYELNLEKFMTNDLYIQSEWAKMEDYSVIEKKERIVTIPAGRYVCFWTYIWRDNSWVDVLRKFLTENNLTPKRIFAEEVSFYIYEYKDICHEVRILIDEDL